MMPVDLASFKVACDFETKATKERGREYTNPDGSPNTDAIYGTDSYDDMVAGVKRIMSIGAVIAGNVICVGSADGNLYALMWWRSSVENDLTEVLQSFTKIDVTSSERGV